MAHRLDLLLGDRCDEPADAYAGASGADAAAPGGVDGDGDTGADAAPPPSKLQRRLAAVQRAADALEVLTEGLLRAVPGRHRALMARTGHACAEQPPGGAGAGAGPPADEDGDAMSDAEGDEPLLRLRAEAAAPRCGAPGGGCARPPLPLTAFCAAHVLLDPAQRLYVAGPDGAPALVQVGADEDEPAEAEGRGPAPAAAAGAEAAAGAGAGAAAAAAEETPGAAAALQP